MCCQLGGGPWWWRGTEDGSHSTLFLPSASSTSSRCSRLLSLSLFHSSSFLSLSPYLSLSHTSCYSFSRMYTSWFYRLAIFFQVSKMILSCKFSMICLDFFHVHARGLKYLRFSIYKLHSTEFKNKHRFV